MWRSACRPGRKAAGGGTSCIEPAWIAKKSSNKRAATEEGDEPMKLLTQELRRMLPLLYAQENEKDPMVYVKFFAPWSRWTWYITEFDGKDLFFGLTCGFEDEWGYISLAELERVKGPVGLKIERDLHFKPCTISEAKQR